ncbi:MAG: NrdH-redoxin [Parcubacteria group bacterium SW_6_46_9]|nr:MAG: NrdH-redoxin [Parcubacteria group bacterium SW_6_46_9]
MKKVTLYTTPSCQYCEQAKEYMKEHDIDYKYYDVSEDTDRRKEMIEKSGQMGVPVIELGDELMVGFDEERFEDMIQKHKEENE